MHKRSYEVPQGYFDSLRTELYLIPQRQETSLSVTAGSGRRYSLRPWIAFAAAALSVLAVSLGIIHSSKAPADTLSYEQMLVADLIPHTGIEEYYYNVVEDIPEETDSQEDLYEYLISGGDTTLSLDY